MSQDVPLHPACEPVAFLLGTWTGQGKGHYPTIDDFSYGEELTFSHGGKPFLVYHQRTWDLGTGAPMHSEMGYWRPQPEGRIEVVLTHPFGAVEVAEGSVGAGRIVLRSTEVATTSSAKEIKEVTRTFSISGDTMEYEVAMAAVGLSLRAHLQASLQRSS